MEILLCYNSMYNEIDNEMQNFMKSIMPAIHCRVYYMSSRKIQIEPDITILFKYDFAQEIKGLRPDYFYTDSNEAAQYLRSTHSIKLSDLDSIIKLINNYINITVRSKDIKHSDDKFDALRYSYTDTDFCKTFHNKELDNAPEALIKLKTKLNEIYGTNCFKEKENEIMPTKNIFNSGTLYINGIPLGHMYPEIKNVIFSGPCTIVIWSDGDKTIVRCNDKKFDKEKGLAMAIAKKFLGTNKSKSNYNDIFKKWIKD